MKHVSAASPLQGRRLPRPTRDALRVGPGALAAAIGRLPAGFTVVTQPGPLAALPAGLLDPAGLLVHATTLARGDLESLASHVPSDAPVLGIGGGVVMDTAKWLAHRRAVPLVLAPSIISVDACVTNTVAVRDDGGVVYEGFVVPAEVVLDTEVIRAAPPALNRAGLGDVLSIHTALWDWQRAATYDPRTASAALAVLTEVLDTVDDLRDVTDTAIATLVGGFADINDLTVACGHAQMEEGSEHYLAYCLEARTGRGFVHGELVTLGVVLMSRLQDNDPDLALAAAVSAGVDWQPAHLGLTRDDLTGALAALPEFVTAGGYARSVIDLRPERLRDPAALLSGLEFA